MSLQRVAPSGAETRQAGAPLARAGLRAAVIALVATAALSLANPYLAFVSHTWEWGMGSLLTAPLLLLFLLVAANGALLRWAPRAAFARGELLLTYSLLLVPTALLIHGGLPYFAPTTAYPFYLANQANDWQHLIWPSIPTWLRPGDPGVAGYLWEGAPGGQGVPWAAWRTPLLAWGAFTAALYAAMFCLASLLRPDWTDRQRLTFPLMEVPLAMAGEEARPCLSRSIFANRVFWLGFAIPAALSLLEWLNRLFPSVPVVSLGTFQPGRVFAGMGLPWSVLSNLRFSLLLPVVGISCLIPARVSLSLWVFYLLFWLQLLAWASFGVTGGGAPGVNVDPYTLVSFQEAGGFLAVAALTLYQSRAAFAGAWRALLGRTRARTEPGQVLSERAALVGFFAANLFLLVWALAAGLTWWSYLLLILVFYAVLIGTARLVAAAGLMFTDTGFFPHHVVIRTLGSATLGRNSLTLYSYLACLFMWDPHNLGLPEMMNGLKLVQAGRLRGRGFPLAMALVVLTAIGLGLVGLLLMLHRHGAATLDPWPFTAWPERAFGELEGWLRNPEAPSNWLRAALVAGAALALLLSWLQSQFVGWPLSPVGFLIASSWGMNWLLWPGILLGWAISSLVRHYGGLALFRRLRPAFIGLVLGDLLTRGVLGLLAGAAGLRVPSG